MSWIEKLFVERADIYMEIMNSMWSEGEAIAKGIAEILKRYGLSSGKVLELYSGNGRVAIPLARMGYDVLGVDFSLPFITDAREKAKRYGVEDRVRFAVADARRIDEEIHEKFDAFVIVATSLGYYDGSSDEEVFKRLRNLAKDTSILIIANTVHRETPNWRYCDKVFERFGNLVLLEERKFDPIWSKLYSKWYLYRDEGDGLSLVLRLETEIRVYTPTELAEMLRRSGWGAESVYGDIRKLERFNPPCAHLSLVARAIRTG